METDPRIWIAALRRSHDELVAFVDTLDADGLRRQSACSEWNVAQVLSHLGSAAELALGLVDASVAGREPPGQETYPAVWDRWNAMSPEDAAAAFRVADDRHISALEAFDDEALATVRFTFPFLPEPADTATAARFRLSEHMFHSWDVVVSFRPEVGLAPYCVDLLVEGLGDFMPFLAKPEALGSREGSVALDVATEEPSRRFALDIGDAVSLTEGDAAHADGLLALPAE